MPNCQPQLQDEQSIVNSQEQSPQGAVSYDLTHVNKKICSFKCDKEGSWRERIRKERGVEGKSYEQQLRMHYAEKVSLLRKIIHRYNTRSIEHKQHLTALGLKTSNANNQEGRIFVTQKQIVPRNSSNKNKKQICKITQYDTLQLVSGSRKGNLQRRQWFVQVKQQSPMEVNEKQCAETKRVEINSSLLKNRKTARKNKVLKHLKDSLQNVEYSLQSPRTRVIQPLSIKLHQRNSVCGVKCLQPPTSHNSAVLPSRQGIVNTRESQKRNSAVMKTKIIDKDQIGSKCQIIENCLTQKMNKYRQMLFLLNWSNNIYKNMEIYKYDRPLKFFIGSGNNSNLLKNLMKRRFWFEPTTDKTQAHFVWTQLQCQIIYEKQLQNTSLRVITSQTTTNPLNNNLSLFKDSYSLKCSISLQKIKLSKQIQVNLFSRCGKQTAETSKRIQGNLSQKNSKEMSQQVQLKLLTQKQFRTYKKLLANRKKPLRFTDRLRSMKGIIVTEINEKVHNHLPSNGLLGNKKAMFYLLRDYYRAIQKSTLLFREEFTSIWDVVPLTYHVKKGIQDEEYKAFEMQYGKRHKAKKINAWVVKPGEFSNRGQGIGCTRKIEEVRKMISRLRGQGKTAIIQSYICKPMLYHGRKFDLRCFMLITSVNGYLRGYWYKEGYVRTSSFQWDLQDMGREAHLTNDAVQKNYEEYGKYEIGNKLTFLQLQKYLAQNGQPGVLFMSILPQIKKIATDAIRASSIYIGKKLKSAASLNPSLQQVGNNFQLFGLDFMVDRDCRPWLIEINTNPCLETSSPVLERLIPFLVENTLRLALDPLFPPQGSVPSNYKYDIPYNALHYNKFQLVFDHSRDASSVAHLLSNSCVLNQITEFEEQKQIYQEEGVEEDIQF